MIEFFYHEGIKKEIAAIERRFRNIKEGLTAFERICEFQFNPIDPKQVIGPAKLHRISTNNVWAIWKIELAIPKSGLRPSQFPRVWFAVKGASIVFLCLGTHINNYSDNERESVALSRVTDYF